MKLPKKAKNKKGLKINSLEILEFIGTNKLGRTLWRCKCDCGTLVELDSCALNPKGTKSCGCAKKSVWKQKSLNKQKDLLNKRFGMLEVLRFSHNKNGTYYWECKCDCGAVKVINGSSIKHGHSRSCGCLAKIARQLDRGKAAENRFFDSYIFNAKSRNIEVKLSKEDFIKLAKSNCYYCGREPSTSMKKKYKNLHGDFIYNGIDRVDNSKGYTIKNCVPACGTCNIMKKDLSIDDFLNHIKSIIDYQNHIFKIQKGHLNERINAFRENFAGVVKNA